MKIYSAKKLLIVLIISCVRCITTMHAQGLSHTQLEINIKQITKTFKGKIGVSVMCPETPDTFTMNDQIRFPMQSVYKFPLALKMISDAEKGLIKLEDKIHISEQDLLDDTWSPMKDKYPHGNIDLTINELLKYAVSMSDNIACDILFKLTKGPEQVNHYLHEIGYPEIEVHHTERELHAEPDKMFQNSCKPSTMTRLLYDFSKGRLLNDSGTRYLLRLMTESQNSPKRIKGLLPEGTVVAHKTGTCSLKNHFVEAINDVGIICLPDGSHVIISIFMMNASASIETCERTEAKITRIIYDHYLHKMKITR